MIDKTHQETSLLVKPGAHWQQVHSGMENSALKKVCWGLVDSYRTGSRETTWRPTRTPQAQRVPGWATAPETLQKVRGVGGRDRDQGQVIGGGSEGLGGMCVSCSWKAATFPNVEIPFWGHTWRSLNFTTRAGAIYKSPNSKHSNTHYRMQK